MRLACVVAVMLVAAGPALAGRLEAFNQAVEGAWNAARTAIVHLVDGDDTRAAIALDEATADWVDLPPLPAPYAATDGAAAEIDRIGAVLADAQALVAAADLKGALTLLRPIGADLHALRLEAGVRVFADCIFELDAALTDLAAWRAATSRLVDTGAANALKYDAAVAHHMATRCRLRAPAAAGADAAFIDALDAVIAALADMPALVDAGDRAALRTRLAAIETWQWRLWLEQG